MVSYPESFQMANRLLAFLKQEYHRFQKRANPLRLIREALSEKAVPAQPNPKDVEFLLFILSRCVSDPDPDDSSALSDAATDPAAATRSPLAATMLQEDLALEDEIRRAHSARSACVWRRRVLVNERIATHPTSPPLGDPVADLIMRSALCGAVYRDLVSFADAYGTAVERRVLLAVANFVYAFGRAYFRVLLSVVVDECVTPLSRRVAAVVQSAEQFVADGCLIAEILTAVEETDGSAVAILDVLLDASVRHAGNETVMQLFYVAVSPYFDYLLDWFFQGSSHRDPAGEFFATVLGVSSTASETLLWSTQLEDASTVTFPPFPAFLNPSDALFLLRAGRGRNLLELFELNSGPLAERPPDFAFGDPSVCFDDVNKAFSTLADRVEAFEETRAADDAAPRLRRIVSDDDSASPAWKKPADTRTARGKYTPVKCTHEEDGRFVGDLPDSPSCIGSLAFRFPDLPSDPEEEEEPTAATSKPVERAVTLQFSSLSEVDGQLDDSVIESVMPATRPKPRFPLGGMFASELFKPLARIDNVVQREVLRHFIEHLDLFDHLRNLRAYVLLGAGDFANELIDQMELASHTSEANERFITQRTSASMTFYGTGGPGERVIRDRAYLNQCLRTALNLCSSAVNAHTDLLYLDSEVGGAASDWKDGDRRPTTPQSPMHSPTASLWEKRMEMRYDVEYPLSIIITEQGMQQYSKVFGLFLRILRARKSLRRLFVASRRKLAHTRRTPAVRPPGAVLKDPRLAGRVWQFCWHAEHFVSIFGGFVMEQVLGSCWDEFESKWPKVCSVWEFRAAHNTFLDDCVRRCLLDDEHRNVLKVMIDGFDIVSNVERHVVNLDPRDVTEWSVDTRNVMDLLLSATASLKRRCAFLTDVLQRLLDGGTLPHLEHFLTRLNFNHYNWMIETQQSS